VTVLGDPRDEITIVEAIASLRRDGFGGDFSVAPGGLVRCAACVHNQDPADLVVEAVVRGVGISGPADEAAAHGLSCSRCGSTGVLVVGYGPTATEDEATVVTTVGDQR
jgi:hypothetical protein